MKITITKGDVKFEYEEPQIVTDYLKICSKDYQPLLMTALKSIFEHITELSKRN